MSLPIQAATVRTTAEWAAIPSGSIRRRGSRRSAGVRACALAIVMVLVGSSMHAVVADQAEPSRETKEKADPKRDSKAASKADAAKNGREVDALLGKLLPPRSDTPADWHASVECLHAPGEPRWLRPCVPPPPCDPSQPPNPFDLVGVRGQPTCGPIYRGPCEPRSRRHHHGAFAWYHHMSDRMFDRFYRSK